ncbi:deoxyguanosinetriphosphate triphosphohydrolase [Aequorivita vladivostokensis]|uniref:DGTPase n=1 Tax=Aequorivita vladivostokensis TaxID=171194 RepID=A0ABR5DMV8_9FLAO|nr:deoxyguanosinetriphosphate triphosphohydrolase [Aequorivita vladivostokensis]KJJ40092.1 dGTPase [Aequorivita vladivostokensis]MAB57988.1 deoxyguanosinetriphosphate triphosphohydrolase [Aequorivita sp.]MAO47248.1 deoxyguanosinetriphosphate triphosphohydrolase [Aequorivita sp.]MBF32099.1 deoxyguanosinetriphosphate triphosphohydrolase [Aequorivita sp.]
MQWEQLLSLRKHGDKNKRLRIEENETRLGFEVDYDRVIFSSAFRSLQDKTQVIPLSKTSFVHTRLTHSLEVSVVGRSLGRIVGKEILKKHPQLQGVHGYQFNDFGAIVAAAALAHDIGNPPFGHSGEKAIGDYFLNGNGKRFKNQLSEKEYQDLVAFEGNANGFKILTESKNGVEGGLRLTFATLGAFMKYPKQSLPKKPTSHVADKKFGVFQSDTDFFNEVVSELGLLNRNDNGFARHPLAYLVEAADDICYTIIDFEDGINLGLIEEEIALEYLINLVRDSLKKDIYSRLRTVQDRLAYLRSLAINTLISEAATIFIENEEEILNGTFSEALLDRSQYRAQIADIIKISVEKVYQSTEVTEKEIAGYTILTTLLEALTTAFENYHNERLRHYDKILLQLIGFNSMGSYSVYDYLMESCSYISRLTDGNALQIFQKIRGNL